MLAKIEQKVFKIIRCSQWPALVLVEKIGGLSSLLSSLISCYIYCWYLEHACVIHLPFLDFLSQLVQNFILWLLLQKRYEISLSLMIDSSFLLHTALSEASMKTKGRCFDNPGKLCCLKTRFFQLPSVLIFKNLNLATVKRAWYLPTGQGGL